MGMLARRRRVVAAGGPAAPTAHQGVTYRDAGVDVAAKTDLLEKLAPAVRQTYTPGTAPWGGFAGALTLPGGIGRIALTIDGVGTKTILAHRLGRHRVIGADIVAHCANDLVAAGASPLCFLDYVALPRLDPVLLSDLMAGMTDACARLGVPLVAGETAEMPDVYVAGAYDLVGVMAGVVRFDLGRDRVRAGDVIIGLASTGLHTNGFALARRVAEGADLDAPDPTLGTSPADALLAPHRCYAPAVLDLLPTMPIHAVAHITGGGLPGNIIRILPQGLRARLDRSWPIPPVFTWLQRRGRISDGEMRRTFNLGVGMTLLVAAEDAPGVLASLHRQGQEAWVIGAILKGKREVVFR